jgi:hypothetical protein
LDIGDGILRWSPAVTGIIPRAYRVRVSAISSVEELAKEKTTRTALPHRRNSGHPSASLVGRLK